MDHACLLVRFRPIFAVARSDCESRLQTIVQAGSPAAGLEPATSGCDRCSRQLSYADDPRYRIRIVVAKRPLADIERLASDGFMAVEKSRLFEQAKDRWPRRLRVYPTNGFPPFDAKPSLVDVHNDIQAACDPQGDWTEEEEWTGLANWSFHQALRAVANQSTAERNLDRDEVTFEMFDERMRSNLANDCWVAERHQYEESPLRFH